MVARYFLFGLHEPEILRKSLLLMKVKEKIGKSHADDYLVSRGSNRFTRWGHLTDFAPQARSERMKAEAKLRPCSLH